MARKPTETPETPAEVDMPGLPGLPVAAEAANQLAVLHEQRQAAVRAVAAQMGYQLPADCTDPDLIQRDIAANMRRSVEACLEVGRGLRVLKEACEHGNFIARLEVLDMDHSVAKRFMQAAAKFSNGATSHHLTKALGSQSKLFEMLVLDDEQIEELELTGQTGELKLDDIATMSVKELRTAVRNLRGDLQARDDVLNKTHKDLVKLQVQMGKKIAADTDWPDALAPIEDQIAAAGRKVAQGLSEMEICRVRIFEVGAHVPSEQRVKYEAALEHVAVLYEQALERAEAKVAKERRTYEQTLADYRPIEYGPDEGFATAPRLDAA